MPGTRAGALKTKAKNLAKDPNYYANIGKEGGKNSSNGGFASDKVGQDGLTGKQRAAIAGKVGGTVSKRGKHTFPPKVEQVVYSPVKRPLWRKLGSFMGL